MKVKELIQVLQNVENKDQQVFVHSYDFTISANVDDVIEINFKLEYV